MPNLIIRYFQITQEHGPQSLIHLFELKNYQGPIACHDKTNEILQDQVVILIDIF